MAMDESWEVNLKQVIIKMADGSVFGGEVNVRGFKRLSDYLRATDDRFIVILSDREKSKKAVMVNKSFILWAEETG